MLEIVRQFKKLRIKELNDDLGTKLGNKTICVEQVSCPQLVDVWIDVIYPNGTVKQMPLSQYRSLRAVGLRLETYYGAAV